MKAYGEIALTDSSPAQTFTEPLSLADAKTFLRLGSSTTQDTTIQTMISAAREQAEILQNKDLIAKQYDLHLDLLLGYDAIAGAAYPMRFNFIYNFGIDYGIDLRYPLRSVDLFQTTDSDGNVNTLVAGRNNDYVADLNRARVLPAFGKTWPFYTPDVTSSVLIRFTSGYSLTHPFWSNSGKRILMGMQMLITAWFEQRLPFHPEGRGTPLEFPYSITECLSYGARQRAC